ncbi:MAG: phospholipid carrier-dependent glycosyltransferase, partial [Armatimonadetes bacterium]|nr:phospholipid carrier-dependent glycosyltransferase [Armatimonadota bacterium]
MRVRVIAILTLSLLLVTALVFRLCGINWGLPNKWHFFSYHPDEATVALCTLFLDIFSLRMNPHHFNYGSLFIYLVYFAVLFAIGIGSITPQSVLTLSYWRGIHIVGRLLNAFIGALTVAVVWKAARIAYGNASALLSALLIALVPIHVQHSHFMTVDVSLAFWNMVSLLYALRTLEVIDQGKREAFKMLLLSGFFGGLAVGTKYGVFLPLCFVWLLAAYYIAANCGSQSESILTASPKFVVLKMFGLTVAMCVIGFIIVCPYSILAWREFIAGISFEAKHMRMGHGELFLKTGNGHIYHLRVNLNSGMGLPLMLASIFGVIWAFFRRRPQDMLLLLFVLTYFGIVGCFKVRFARYLMPIIPPLCILAGNAMCEVF